MNRFVVLVGGFAFALVIGPADAANKLTLSAASVAAERGAVACASTSCTTTFVPETPFRRGQWVCAGTSMADSGPSYRCSVFVGAALFGRAVADRVPVQITFEVVSDDGAPWNDDVRRTLRGQAVLMRSPAAGAPAPCPAVPSPEPRVSCAKVGPRTWKVSTTTKSKTGTYIAPLQIEFPSSTGTAPVCEYLRLKGTAKSAGQTARFDLGRRKYCA